MKYKSLALISLGFTIALVTSGPVFDSHAVAQEKAAVLPNISRNSKSAPTPTVGAASISGKDSVKQKSSPKAVKGTSGPLSSPSVTPTATSSRVRDGATGPNSKHSGATPRKQGSSAKSAKKALKSSTSANGKPLLGIKGKGKEGKKSSSKDIRVGDKAVKNSQKVKAAGGPLPAAPSTKMSGQDGRKSKKTGQSPKRETIRPEASQPAASPTPASSEEGDPSTAQDLDLATPNLYSAIAVALLILAGIGYFVLKKRKKSGTNGVPPAAQSKEEAAPRSGVATGITTNDGDSPAAPSAAPTPFRSHPGAPRSDSSPSLRPQVLKSGLMVGESVADQNFDAALSPPRSGSPQQIVLPKKNKPPVAS